MRVEPIVIPLDGQPLSLDQSLGCGQAFRWTQLGPEEWHGVAGRAYWHLRIVDDSLHAWSAPDIDPELGRNLLTKYFRLGLDVIAVQIAIAAAHPAAAAAVRQFAGLRILDQEPIETLLTFAIATATNVPRVTRSIREMCARYGPEVAFIEDVMWFGFPSLEALDAASVDELYGPCNLAYRARSIKAVARTVAGWEATWPDALRSAPYSEAHVRLDSLPFFGPKVSDCVCLFGLGFDQAVPVDVHVWAIAHELFGESIPTRTLTPLTYEKIGHRFRDVFGSYAGWAQQYLFCARRAIPIRDRFRPQASNSP